MIATELSAAIRAVMDCRRGENEKVEFKPFISRNDPKENEIVRTVIAFSNTQGGRIYLGVGDADLRPLGETELRKSFRLKKDAALQEQINAVRLLITNKAVPIPRFRVESIYLGGDPIVVVTIEREPGTLCGTRDNDFYVRRGSSNYRATDEEICNTRAVGLSYLF